MSYLPVSLGPITLTYLDGFVYARAKSHTNRIIRARRIKCDERWPYCKNCLATGRICDRYIVGESQLPAAALGHQPSQRLWPLDVSPSVEGREMFHFFRSEGVNQVVGYFDASFWTVDVLRAAQVYPAIWHAMLAMAAMQNWAD